LLSLLIQSSVAQVSITTDDNLQDDSTLFCALAQANISIDMINFFIDKKVFIVDKNQVDCVKKIMDKLEFNYNILNCCSKVTIIGSRIAGIPGVMSTIVTSFANENIKILQSTDSRSTISCLINEDDAKKAVNLLHGAFHLDE